MQGNIVSRQNLSNQLQSPPSAPPVLQARRPNQQNQPNLQQKREQLRIPQPAQQNRENYLQQESGQNSTWTSVLPTSADDNPTATSTDASTAASTENSYSDEEKNVRIERIKERRNNRESSTLIIASSITRDINKKEFNDNYRYGNARLFTTWNIT